MDEALGCLGGLVLFGIFANAFPEVTGIIVTVTVIFIVGSIVLSICEKGNEIKRKKEEERNRKAAEWDRKNQADVNLFFSKIHDYNVSCGELYDIYNRVEDKAKYFPNLEDKLISIVNQMGSGLCQEFLIQRALLFKSVGANRLLPVVDKARIYINRLEEIENTAYSPFLYYGKMNQQFMNEIKSQAFMHRVNDILLYAEARANGCDSLSVDPREIKKCLYACAFQRNQDKRTFERSKRMINRYIGGKHIQLEILISDIIAAADVGLSRQQARNIDDYINKELTHRDHGSQTISRETYAESFVVDLASAMCAIGEYELEQRVLESAYQAEIPLNPSEKDRLRFLQSGAMNAKSLYKANVSGESNGTLPLELDSLRWSARDYDALFEQIQACGRNALQYALAVRFSTKTVTLSREDTDYRNRITPDTDEICRRIEKRLGSPCRYMAFKPLNDKPALRGFAVRNGAAGAAVMIHFGINSISFSPLVFLAPGNGGLREQQSVVTAMLSDRAAMEQKIRDMLGEIQLYLQEEMDKLKYKRRGNTPDPKPSDKKSNGYGNGPNYSDDY